VTLVWVAFIEGQHHIVFFDMIEKYGESA